jgi:hypothetical protein
MEHSHYLKFRRTDMIAFRKATKGMLCDDIYVHMWNLIRKEFENYERIPPTTNEFGSKCWRKGDGLHREFDLPAFESRDFKTWSLNGLIHRDGDLPAEILLNVYREIEDATWYKHGVIHRNGDKPAVIKPDLCFWYKAGKIHRDGDKPAIISKGEFMGGTKWWIKNNALFREGGKPTIVKRDGTQIWANSSGNWWLPHIEYDPWFKGIRTFQIDADGTKRWFIYNIPGREGDEPSVVYPNGTQIWYKKCEIKLTYGFTYRTMIHRDGGKPAIICADGSKSWYYQGKLISCFKHGKFITCK